MMWARIEAPNHNIDGDKPTRLISMEQDDFDEQGFQGSACYFVSDFDVETYF